MNDRQLLELAAKAAGDVVVGWDNWNPLEDDGDALRLAVKLRMDIEWFEKRMVVAVLIYEKADAEEEYVIDPCAATRRAIVRAAAEIGKEMA